MIDPIPWAQSGDIEVSRAYQRGHLPLRRLRLLCWFVGTLVRDARQLFATPEE
jgi:hypothetical protein